MNEKVRVEKLCLKVRLDTSKVEACMALFRPYTDEEIGVEDSPWYVGESKSWLKAILKNVEIEFDEQGSSEITYRYFISQGEKPICGVVGFYKLDVEHENNVLLVQETDVTDSGRKHAVGYSSLSSGLRTP